MNSNLEDKSRFWTSVKDFERILIYKHRQHSILKLGKIKAKVGELNFESLIQKIKWVESILTNV